MILRGKRERGQQRTERFVGLSSKRKLKAQLQNKPGHSKLGGCPVSFVAQERGGVKIGVLFGLTCLAVGQKQDGFDV